jgi:hypothetical protein
LCIYACVPYNGSTEGGSKTAFVLLKAVDTASTFDPLAPFYALIGKAVKQIEFL